MERLSIQNDSFQTVNGGKAMSEQEAKQVLEKMLEHIDEMPMSTEVVLIGEALRIAMEKLNR